MFCRAAPSRGLGVEENDPVHPGGVTHPEPEHDVAPGPVPQSHHATDPELVQHRDQVQSQVLQCTNKSRFESEQLAR